jgi:hypothetical protein
MKSKLTINQDGTKEWKLPNGIRHRENGPAVEYIGGTKSWWINGACHREDGPAIEYGDDYKRWFLNGKQYTEIEYKYEMRSRKLKQLL